MAAVAEAPDSAHGYTLIVGSNPAGAALQSVLEPVTPVMNCPGSQAGECPAVLLRPCPLRDGARAAVVFFAGEHEFFRPGRWDCVMGGSMPSVAVLEGMDFSPRGREGLAVVGSEQGPIGILKALSFAEQPASQTRR